VAHHLPDEAEELLKKRFQIINVSNSVLDGCEIYALTLGQVWRPIRPIYKDPLAVADAHSVPDSDLVGTALICK
jgi:hypothetical protein